MVKMNGLAMKQIAQKRNFHTKTAPRTNVRGAVSFAPVTARVFRNSVDRVDASNYSSNF